LKLFWDHIMQKHPGDRKKRLKFYDAAIELLQRNTIDPITKMNPNGRNELVHRFAGRTREGDLFYVQVKQELRTGSKHFMSVFPETRK